MLWCRAGYDPDVDPLELEPEEGPVPYPAGGVPVCAPEPLPMFGQFWDELDPDELDEPELEVPDPELPVLELEGVVVDESEVELLDVELVPVLPVVLDVVAASATSAPPATRPEVSAPMASTLRSRIFMGGCPFVSRVTAGPLGPAPHTLRHGPECRRTTTWASARSYLTN